MRAVSLASALSLVFASCSSGDATNPSAATDAATASDAATGPGADGSSATRADGGPGGDAAGWAFAPTTSVAELTANNTSASSSWTGKITVNGNLVDAYWDEVPGNVSKVPVSALLPGYDVPVFVETQNWWRQGSGHIDNGEDSTTSAQIAAQVVDHISRGFAGQVLDWYAQGDTADKALGFVKTNAEASGGKYQFAAMIDKGYFQQTCGETVACLNAAIAYITSTYGTSPAYVKDSAGHPLIFFFVNQYYPTEYGILGSTGIDYKNAKLVMYEPNGFPGNAPPSTVGEYAWVNPADNTPGDSGFADLTGFFANAGKSQTSLVWSAAWKGFDDHLASWGLNRVIDQQCGKVWLQTFHHTGSFGGSSSYVGNLDFLQSGKRIDAIMIDTWDDYEEGSEIETGIDNCLASLAVTLEGTTLGWTPAWGQDPANPSITGDEQTIYRYGVYVAKPGQTNLMWLTDVPCTGGACPHTIDVSTFGIAGGPFVFYVQAVGQPSIRNTLSGATSATYP